MPIEKTKYAAEHGNTGFTPLPPEEHGHLADDCCACPYCSPDGRMAKCHTGVWDTRATSLATGETWLVHYPELHGRPRLNTRGDVILGRKTP